MGNRGILLVFEIMICCYDYVTNCLEEKKKNRKNKIDELNKREGKNKNKDSFKYTKNIHRSCVKSTV